MHSSFGKIAACVVALSLSSCVGQVKYFKPSATSGLPSGMRCDVVNRGLTYIRDYPDGRRYFIVSILTSASNPPTVEVVIYKGWRRKGHFIFGNAEAERQKIDAENAPFEAWQNDRTHPFAFSSDTVRVTWSNGGASYQIPGLTTVGDHFDSVGNINPTIVPFDVRFTLTGFGGDWFDVEMPSVTLDGTTVRPPKVHFTRTTTTALFPINC